MNVERGALTLWPVEGHAGKLVFGRLGGLIPAVLMVGRMQSVELPMIVA